MQVFECPKCGAVLNINGDEEYIVCEYCDSKIKLDLPHEEKHNEDAVKLRQIEVEREFKLKAIEKEEQEAAKKNKVKKITMITWLGVSAILLLISVIKMNLSDSDGLGGFFMLFYVFLPVFIGGGILLFKVIPDRERDKKLLQSGGIRLPSMQGGYRGKNVVEVEQVFYQAGFTNVQCISMNDVVLGIFQRPNIVENVIIGGSERQTGGRVYMPNVSIVIRYHGR